MADALLAALALEVHPLILFELGVMLLQLRLMRVFQSLDLLLLLLAYLFAVVLGLAQVLGELEVRDQLLGDD